MDKHLKHVLEPLSIEMICASAVKRFSGSGIVIDTAMREDLPQVLANKVGISHCLQSLIDNAIKYSNGASHIELRASVGAASFGQGQEVSISVIDHGIGIDKSELQLIWDPFYRSPRVRNAQIHGTGLGLALTKRIIESMGGRVSVDSAVNRGTTFTLHLPAAPVAERLLEKSDLPAEVPHA